MHGDQKLQIAFVVGLGDKKLAQKLAPLLALEEVERIDLYRRRRFQDENSDDEISGPKIRWMGRSGFLGRGIFGELRRALLLLLYGRRYDLIIGCHQRFHGYYAFLAGLLHGAPVVQLTITDPAWIETLPGATTLLQRAAAVGFRGETTLERHRRLYPQAAARQALFALPNAWRLPAAQPDTPLETKTIDVLYVGYLAGYKDIPTWLRAFALLREQRPETRGTLVGEQPSADLRRLIDELDLATALDFPGRLGGDDLEDVYARSRVLLLTSRWEGLPQVALEAMAHGVPVVATDVGDLRDLIEPTYGGGTLIPTTNPRAAAEAVAELLNDETAWHQASKAAREAAIREAEKGTTEKLSAIWRKTLKHLHLLS